MRNTTVLAAPPKTPGTPIKQTLHAGCVLFCDFDGPIADVSDRYYHTYESALATTQAAHAVLGNPRPIRKLTKTQFWWMKQNRVPDTAIADRSGLSAEGTDYFLKCVDELVNRPTLLHQDRLQPGAKTALIALKKAGVQVAIVTLRHAAQVQDFLRQHGLTPLIQHVYGASESTAAYPNRVEHKVMQLRGAIADQHRQGRCTAASWMIGDTEADVCAGQALGLPTVAVTCGIRSSSYLKRFEPTHTHRNLYAATEFLMAA